VRCPGTYTDGDTSHFKAIPEYNWTHAVSAVISALLRAGLQLEVFTGTSLRWPALRFTLYQRWPQLQRDDGGKTFRFPEGHSRLPRRVVVQAERSP